jgi:predicted house-cleaning NTP pyrophosphatase (Maf/HAM1 superfamily)
MCRLVEAFGSTRRKRQMKQREEGAVVVTRNADEDRLGLLLGEVAARATAAGETRAEVRSALCVVCCDTMLAGLLWWGLTGALAGAAFVCCCC